MDTPVTGPSTEVTCPRARRFRRSLAVGGAALLASVATTVFLPGPAVLRTTPLGDLRIVSRAHAASATTQLAFAVSAANVALQQVQNQTLQWTVSDSEFIPSLTKVVDPSGQVLYQTNNAINAWVLRMTAPPQCEYNLVEGVVVFDDNWQNVVMASALETNTQGPTAAGCATTPVTSTDPTPLTPQTSTPAVSQTLPGLPVAVPGNAPGASICIASVPRPFLPRLAC
jgi:hypothetical protein